MYSFTNTPNILLSAILPPEAFIKHVRQFISRFIHHVEDKVK